MPFEDGGRGVVRALVIGALAVLVVVAGAAPAHAGKPGRPGPGEGSHQAAKSGNGAATNAQGPAVGRSQPAARPTPKPAARPAAKPASATRSAPKSRPGPAPTAQRPNRPRGGHPPQHPEPTEPVQVEGDLVQPQPEPDVEPVEVQPTADEPAVRPLSTTGVRVRDLARRPFPSTDGGRPGATARGELAAPPAAMTLAPPGASATTLAAGALDPRQARPVWPSLLPPIDHPAFPGLLLGMLAGFAALACRGDRRDPKLNRSMIDDRDRRTSFR